MVYGKQDDDAKEAAALGFSTGEIAELGGKPSMLGAGCNLQKHCPWEIFSESGSSSTISFRPSTGSRGFCKRHRPPGSDLHRSGAGDPQEPGAEVGAA